MRTFDNEAEDEESDENTRLRKAVKFLKRYEPSFLIDFLIIMLIRLFF